jgi:predicted transcriptional regulator
MMQRNLTITLESDWKAALRSTAKRAKARTYQGEVLNFETPAQFFGQLTQKRWDLVRVAQGRGALSVRELARLVGRDVKRVHEDVTVLATLGILERTEEGGVICPFGKMHIDMYLEPA